MQTTPEQEPAIAGLRAAYAASNRGDIAAAVELFDSQIEWTEPAEFPGGGTYHGQAGAKAYLTQSRESAAEVQSEPERFIPVGDRIVVFVHARVRAHNSDVWQDVRLADVFRFRSGKVVQMRAFADRQDALRWVGMLARASTLVRKLPRTTWGRLSPRDPCHCSAGKSPATTFG